MTSCQQIVKQQQLFLRTRVVAVTAANVQKQTHTQSRDHITPHLHQVHESSCIQVRGFVSPTNDHERNCSVIVMKTMH